MDAKGMSLLEVLLVMLLIGIITTSTLSSVRMVEEAKFTCLGQEVEMALHTAQQRAHLQNKRVRISHYIAYPGYKHQLCMTAQTKLLYTITMPKNIKLYVGSKDYASVFGLGELAFYADMSPTKGGTITLLHQELQKIIQITVRPATGKLTLYKSNIKTK